MLATSDFRLGVVITLFTGSHTNQGFVHQFILMKCFQMDKMLIGTTGRMDRVRCLWLATLCFNGNTKR